VMMQAWADLLDQLRGRAGHRAAGAVESEFEQQLVKS
jgi:hypothetical protein